MERVCKDCFATEKSEYITRRNEDIEKRDQWELITNRGFCRKGMGETED